MPTPTTVITSCTTGIVSIAATVSLVMGCRVVRVLMVRGVMIDEMRAEMGGIGQMGVDRQGCRLSAGVTRAGGG